MITRREFTQFIAGGVAAIALKPRTGFAADALRASPHAADLYRHAFVLDGNTLSSIGLQLASDQDATIKLIRDSGVTAVKSTLGGSTGNFEQAIADIAAAEQLIETRPDAFLKVRTYDDLEHARAQRKLGVIYSFEAANMLEDKVERIALFRQLGVRVMQLTYNRSTPFGVGCLDGDDGGLTDLGREAVAKMNAVGVALDLSHSNTQTTAEGIAVSSKPPIVTHAGCRAIYVHPRNKEDREMRALADKGGVMGIYMLPFLAASPRQPMLEDYMQHMQHALKICGEDHVGIGSDVPFGPVTDNNLEEIRKDVEQRKAVGVSAPGEDRPPYIPDLNTARKMELVADALLKRGYSNRVAEKVLGANFRRVFAATWIA